MKTFFILMILSMVNIGLSQVGQKHEVYPLVKKSSVKKFKIEEGSIDHNFKLDNGEEWTVGISIPKLVKDAKVPLILALHWAGNKSTFKEFNDCLVKPAIDSLGAIVIVPSSKAGNWTSLTNEKKVINLVKQIIKHWPIDKSRVLVLGYSNGGVGAWEYSRKYSKLFSESVAIAGSYSATKNKVTNYIIHGNEDELFNCKEVQSQIDKSIKKGSKIEIQILEGYSHFMACSYMEALRKTLKSIKASSWDINAQI